MTSTTPPVCVSCVHLDLDDDGSPGKCEAFPSGIPGAIWFEGDPHTTPVAGDHGVQFELAPGAPDPTEDVNDED